MKLSQLVDYLNHLDRYVPDRAQESMHRDLGAMLHQVNTHEQQYADITEALNADYNQVQQSITQFNTTLTSLKQRIRREIEEEEPRYFAASYRIYEEEMVHDSAEYILSRKVDLPEKSFEYVRGRILGYSDWHHAGMIIRPGGENWIEDLVALDPLYLIDENHDLLRPARERFNPIYQSRLCVYTVKERSDEELMSTLPQGQFGFVLAYNFFNYKPLELIKRYMTEIYTKLRNGGILAFTFNNCDLAGGVANAERCFMCYTPGGLIRSLAESIGYEIHQYRQLDSANQWLEIRKPGKLTSLRGGQTLVTMLDK